MKDLVVSGDLYPSLIPMLTPQFINLRDTPESVGRSLFERCSA